MDRITIFLLTFWLPLTVSGQFRDVEKQKLRTAEAKSARKMITFNVNPNTQNYNLTYQRLEAAVDPARNYISASVTSHFLVKEALSEIYFDLNDQLKVSTVMYHGQPLNFAQLATKELRITMPQSLSSGSLDSLTVNYAGVPDPAHAAFSTAVQSGSPVLYTLSEPYGAQDWFPTKQSLNDKIDRFDFKITTPAQYSVAANGSLVSESVSGGQKTAFWRTRYPTAAYLIAISVTDFTKLTDTVGNPPFPFVNYLYPATAQNSAVLANIEWTKQAMNTFEKHFGPYPFREEKYGHMQFSFPGTCMEHQTMSSMSSFSKDVIAHELAHQWFGDKITCATWNDIWLNEGFATFGEHLVYEKLLYTPAAFQSYLLSQKNYITGLPGGSVYVADSGLSNDNILFSARLSYAKGGYILRMLKWILGNAAFYQALKDYLSRPELAYGYASTADFAASLRQSTGQDFTEFFKDWLYGQGYPTYNIRWNQSADRKAVTLLINQKQSDPSVSFFEMPLPIRLNGTNGETAYFKVNNVSNNEMVTIPVSFEVASLDFNYELQMLEKSSAVTRDTSLMVQEITGSSPVSVYPVPAGDVLYVKGIKSKVGYELYSIDGKLLQRGTVTAGGPVAVHGLTAGFYIIKIDGNNLKFMKK